MISKSRKYKFNCCYKILELMKFEVRHRLFELYHTVVPSLSTYWVEVVF